MKVNVLTIEDISIGRFRWWSNWIDVAVFTHSLKGQLLQMKVSRTNAKKFRTIKLGSPLKFWSWVSALEVGDLTQMTKKR